jgi:ABC-type Fe3+ transport system substrate-binding protein
MIHNNCLASINHTDPLVFIADIRYFSEMSIPKEWYELLHPRLKNSLVFPSNENYNMLMAFYPFIKNYGLSSMQYLKNNICEIMSPIKMVENIKRGLYSSIALYVMPYSYSSLLAEDYLVRVVWPKEELDNSMRLDGKFQLFLDHFD